MQVLFFVPLNISASSYLLENGFRLLFRPLLGHFYSTVFSVLMLFNLLFKVFLFVVELLINIYKIVQNSINALANY